MTEPTTVRSCQYQGNNLDRPNSRESDLVSDSSSLQVIFRTHSDIEATVLQSLLHSRGIDALISSDVPHGVLPLTVGDLGEVRVSGWLPCADSYFSVQAYVAYP